MNGLTILSICIGASLGALVRWRLGVVFNHIFPSIPLGTLCANIIGGFLIGIFMAINRNHAFISETARLTIVTGFLGGLTTFSTFSAETVTLFSHQEYIMASLIIVSHLAGSLIATILGIYTVKLF